MSLRVRRCLKGLDKAARRKKIFHLWFHPTNMVDEMETMFAGLREILKYADTLKKEGKLEYLTMEEVTRLSKKQF